jgi:hypothetical protein
MLCKNLGEEPGRMNRRRRRLPAGRPAPAAVPPAAHLALDVQVGRCLTRMRDRTDAERDAHLLAHLVAAWPTRTAQSN